MSIDILIKFVDRFTKINKVSIISKMMNFTELYSMIKILIYIKNKSGPITEPCQAP